MERGRESLAAQEPAVLKIEEMGGTIKRDETKPGKPVVGVTFRGPGVTDAGLAHLEGLTNLKSLFLADIGVTDAGLAHLKGLTDLEFLMLSRTGVTDAGVKELQQAMPKVKVRR